MAAKSLPQRALRAVGHSAWSERLARAQELAYGPLIEQVRRSPLHTDVLGHSVHPPLTDITTGCWLATTVLDVAGGPDSRRGATLLATVGLLASVPTAVAGAADWSELSGEQRRIGAVHAVGMDAAIFLFAASVLTRLRGNHQKATKLAAAANTTAAAAGFLGAHLALHHGTARRPAGDEKL
ncbi:DUF2231 domain-containing protein [Kribbella jejuensis]|uniref:DUF2231 domain-containing protein n=1 Tax=Kribbella jejuensis TaxID=236068 RepID=UPI00114E97D5|nr:DUF2231 domain-containing protein [Kribbella jejuensis]